MEKSYKRKALPRHPAVRWSRLKLKWPFLVWLGAIGLAWYLFSHGGGAQPLTGIVDVVRETASPIETARLAAVHVKTGDQVKAGDLLAEMDTTLLDAEMAVEELQLERQFERALLGARSDLHAARTQQARDEAEWTALDQEVQRLEALVARQLIEVEAVAGLRVQRDALARALELHPETVRFLEQELAAAEALKERAQRSLAGGATGDELAELLSLLQRRRDSYALRARQDGVVSSIEKEPGEVVQAGEAVLSLVVEGSQHVIGFLPEWSAYNLAVGQQALLTSPSGRRISVPATVHALGPEILGLPGRVSPVPGQTMRGRRVVLVPEADFDFLPGESVSIHIGDTWWHRFFKRFRREGTAVAGGA